MSEIGPVIQKMLADEEAAFTKVLREHGYVKLEEHSKRAMDFSGCQSAEDFALAVGRGMFREVGRKWIGLINNNGLNDEEVVSSKFLRTDDSSYPEQRNLVKAVQDMKEFFQITLDEYMDTAKKAAKVDERVLRDAMSRIQFPQIMNRVIELPMMESLEPTYALQGLFQNMSIPGMFGDQVTFKFPILGAIEATDIGEDAETPEKTLDLSGGAMVAKFSKIGVGFKYSADFDRFANFDWFNLLMRACRQALSRERELRAYYHISRNGTTVIDNNNRFGFSGSAAAGSVGSAGTDVGGQHNGTHVLEDLFYMMANFNEDGLFPDTVVLSPRAWLIWAQSPEMRAFAWQHGIPRLWQMPQGQRGRAQQHEIAGGLLGNQPDYPRGSSQYTEPPTMLPMSLRIVVSPFVTSGTDSGIEYTNAHVLDTATGIGYVIENQPVTLTEWIDMEHDMRNIRFKERYAYGVLQDNATIRHMKKLKTREIGVDARDRLWFGITWAGGGAGPDIGNPA